MCPQKTSPNPVSCSQLDQSFVLPGAELRQDHKRELGENNKNTGFSLLN